MDLSRLSVLTLLMLIFPPQVILMRFPISGVSAAIWVGSVALGMLTSVRAEPETEVGSAARVTQVEIAGDSQTYRFAVTIESPDTGCERYANWWEVLTPSGELIYRRILAHSHVEEQPFTRSGGPVAIDPEQEVIVRAHMDPDGYGDQGFRGTIEQGLIAVELSPTLAAEVAQQQPLPSGCAF